MNEHTLERMNMRKAVRPGVLVLADGSTFEGELFGARSSTPSSGEVVFNTALTGYQEVISDPSYAGQIVTFTNPHIGNYGVNTADFESRRLYCRGVVVRDLSRRSSNRRAEGDLDALLRSYGVQGIAGIDTRRLTRLIRDTGAIPGALGPAEDLAAVRAAAAAEPGTDGIDLVATVTTTAPYTVGDGDGPRIVAYDYGIKRTILRHLAGLGTVEVVPATTPADEALGREPDGIFLSNGPGDPAFVAGAPDIIRGLLGSGVPVFGICLGHQLLGTALGAATVKLPFGHHGANHPVQDLATGTIEITSQNHNFAVALDTVDRVATMTHVNLNDGVCEGLRAIDADAYSVQHHPEAGPGPHDSSYLFALFAQRMIRRRGGGWAPARAPMPVPPSEPAGLPDPERGVA
jgi:carbamoyl-phosphate synthase small subunit